MPHALLRLVESDVDAVRAVLQANPQCCGPACQRPVALIFGIEAENTAVFRLLELVAAQRVIQKIGEVRKQREAVIQHIAIQRQAVSRAILTPVEGQAVAMGLAAVAGIDIAEAMQAATLHGAQRYLVCRGPTVVVAIAVMLQA